MCLFDSLLTHSDISLTALVGIILWMMVGVLSMMLRYGCWVEVGLKLVIGDRDTGEFRCIMPLAMAG